MKVSADYRMLALDALRGKWKTAVLTGIAASALGATIVSSSNSVVSNSNQGNHIHSEPFSQPNGGLLLAVLLGGIGSQSASVLASALILFQTISSSSHDIAYSTR